VTSTRLGLANDKAGGRLGRVTMPGGMVPFRKEGVARSAAWQIPLLSNVLKTKIPRKDITSEQLPAIGEGQTALRDRENV
jgi:hypothetical protein